MNTMTRTPSAFPRRAAPLAMAVALALGTSPAANAASAAAPNFVRNGAAVLHQQLRALMPPASQIPSSPAATQIVTSCADDDGSGTLRAAIANLKNGGTVDLSALTCSSITLTQGVIPVLLNDLTMIGPGAAALAIDGASADRVLLHPGYGTLRIQGLTVRGGASSVTGYHVTGGGCIASAGYVVLDHSEVHDCFSSGEGVYGAGIFAYSLTLYTSTLSGSVARGSHPSTGTAAFGGGAYVGSLTLVDSTISGNRAEHDLQDGQTSYDTGGGAFVLNGINLRGSTVDTNYSYGIGGGLSVFAGPITIVDSTISGNTAKTRFGGGLDMRVFYGASISNTTVTRNSAPTGGGINLRGTESGITVQSTLVADNSAAGGIADLDAANPAILAGSNNLIGTGGSGLTLPGDTLHGAPQLLPLADNGGPTRTHALQPASPAIDAGNNIAALPSDQRGTGFPRVTGSAPDIGAFEAPLPLPPREPVSVPLASGAVLGALALAIGWLGLGGLSQRQRRLFTHLSPGRRHSSHK